MKSEGTTTLIASIFAFIIALMLFILMQKPGKKKESSNVFFKNGNRYIITTKIWGGVLYKDTILSNK